MEEWDGSSLEVMEGHGVGMWKAICLMFLLWRYTFSSFNPTLLSLASNKKAKVESLWDTAMGDGETLYSLTIP